MNVQDDLKRSVIGKIAMSCPLGITRCLEREGHFLMFFIQGNKSLIDQACLVNTAGYKFRLFFWLVNEP